MDDRQRYLTKGELREEIAYVVGADPTRYGAGSERCLQKADVLRLADRLQPVDSDIDVRKCTLGPLYSLVCRWAGGEYRPNAGRQWGLNRDNLKAIHRAVGGSDPREILIVDEDNGGECS